MTTDELARMLETFARKQERIEEVQSELIKVLEGVVELTGELEITIKSFISFYYENKVKTYKFDTVQQPPQRIVTPQHPQPETGECNNRNEGQQ